MHQIIYNNHNDIKYYSVTENFEFRQQQKMSIYEVLITNFVTIVSMFLGVSYIVFRMKEEAREIKSLVEAIVHCFNVLNPTGVGGVGTHPGGSGFGTTTGIVPVNDEIPNDNEVFHVGNIDVKDSAQRATPSGTPTNSPKPDPSAQKITYE